MELFTKTFIVDSSSLVVVLLAYLFNAFIYGKLEIVTAYDF